MVLFFLVIAAAVIILLSTSGGPPPAGPGQISLEQVRAILINDILVGPANESIAYVCDAPLQSGDVVAAKAGKDITPHTMGGPTYFAFIDDEPNAFFSHDVRYVFIDAATGVTAVAEASWWPDIGNVSMWESEKCNVINVTKNG
jgi:hypothetical protein